MQRVVVIFLAGIFLCSSMIANGQQASSTSTQVGNQGVPNATQDCSRYFDVMREARLTMERDQRTLAARADSGGASEMGASWPQPVDLQQDLKILEQRQTELNRCTIANSCLLYTSPSPRDS